MSKKRYGYGEMGVDTTLRFHVGFADLDGTDFDDHTHAYSELVIALSGESEHLVNGSLERITGGDVFVFNGNSSHAFRKTRNLRLCNIAYDPGKYLTGLRDLRKLPGYHALFMIAPNVRGGHFRSHLHLSPRDLAIALDMAHRLESEYLERNPGFQAMIQSVFLQLVTFLSRQYGEVGREKKNPDAVRRLAASVAYMENHFGEDITLEQLARLAHLSKNQFLRVFRRTYSDTPIDYLNALRTAKACEMMRDQPDTKLVQIALECGFGDGNYFSRVFRKKMGCSPREYRDRLSL